MSIDEIIAELSHLSGEDLAKVEAKLKQLVVSLSPIQAMPIGAHPAVGIWKERTDLPEDSVEASKVLRKRMMQRTDAAE
jgi:hypothetical protein